MRHLLGGVAIAALLAAGLPAAAQNTGTDQQTAPSEQHHPAMSGKHATKRAHHAQSASKKGASQDNMAEELNRQELQRIAQGGGGQAPGSGTTAPAPGMMPGH